MVGLFHGLCPVLHRNPRIPAPNKDGSRPLETCPRGREVLVTGCDSDDPSGNRPLSGSARKGGEKTGAELKELRRSNECVCVVDG